MKDLKIRAELYEVLMETLTERLTTLEKNLTSVKHRVSLTDQAFRDEYRYGMKTGIGDEFKDEIATAIIPNLEKKVALLKELQGALKTPS